jgi:hypothetical protein
MARSRNIKPGFFKNEELAEVEPLGRLLFAGLWTLADREGRLEDRPKRIKVEILPYDNCDVDLLLCELERHKFIIRYEIDGEKYIYIPTFLMHNNPHPNEKTSNIPAAPDEIMTLHYNSRNVTCKNVTNRAESLYSESLISESLSPPYREIVELYNTVCISLRKVRDITEKRRKAIRARWASHNEIEFYKSYFGKVNKSPFLNGANDRNWAADFDWLMGEQNMAKVLEGKYDKGGSGNGQPPGNARTDKNKVGTESIDLSHIGFKG